MCTTRLLPISPSIHCSGWGCTCPIGVSLLVCVSARGCTCQGVYLPGVYLAGVYLPWGCTLQGCTCQGCTCLGRVYLAGGVPALAGCTLQGVLLPGVYLPWQGVPCRGCSCQGCTCLGRVYLAWGAPVRGVPALAGCTCLGRVYLPMWRYLPKRGGTCPGTPHSLAGSSCHVNRMTDRCKNMPCPKLCLQAVIKIDGCKLQIPMVELIVTIDP